MKTEGQDSIMESSDCQVRTSHAHCKRPGAPGEAHSVLCSMFGLMLRMRREGTRKEGRLSRPHVLWPLSSFHAYARKILENQI